eukprot:jgi/Bigna1/72459/fgenesh1_pg.20_\
MDKTGNIPSPDHRKGFAPKFPSTPCTRVSCNARSQLLLKSSMKTRRCRGGKITASLHSKLPEFDCKAERIVIERRKVRGGKVDLKNVDLGTHEFTEVRKDTNGKCYPREAFDVFYNNGEGNEGKEWLEAEPITTFALGQKVLVQTYRGWVAATVDHFKAFASVWKNTEYRPVKKGKAAKGSVKEAAQDLENASNATTTTAQKEKIFYTVKIPVLKFEGHDHPYYPADEEFIKKIRIDTRPPTVEKLPMKGSSSFETCRLCNSESNDENDDDNEYRSLFREGEPCKIALEGFWRRGRILRIHERKEGNKYDVILYAASEQAPEITIHEVSRVEELKAREPTWSQFKIKTEEKKKEEEEKKKEEEAKKKEEEARKAMRTRKLLDRTKSKAAAKKTTKDKRKKNGGAVGGGSTRRNNKKRLVEQTSVREALLRKRYKNLSMSVTLWKKFNLFYHESKAQLRKEIEACSRYHKQNWQQDSDSDYVLRWPRLTRDTAKDVRKQARKSYAQGNYDCMSGDIKRNEAYEVALRYHLKMLLGSWDATKHEGRPIHIMDLGTGASAIWIKTMVKICVEEGLSAPEAGITFWGIETNKVSATKAVGVLKAVKRKYESKLNFSITKYSSAKMILQDNDGGDDGIPYDKMHTDGAALVPYEIDLLVQELIGDLGNSEGLRAGVVDILDKFLVHRMVPERIDTLMALCTVPEPPSPPKYRKAENAPFDETRLRGYVAAQERYSRVLGGKAAKGYFGMFVVDQAHKIQLHDKSSHALIESFDFARYNCEKRGFEDQRCEEQHKEAEAKKEDLENWELREVSTKLTVEKDGVLFGAICYVKVITTSMHEKGVCEAYMDPTTNWDQLIACVQDLGCTNQPMSRWEKVKKGDVVEVWVKGTEHMSAIEDDERAERAAKRYKSRRGISDSSMRAQTTTTTTTTAPKQITRGLVTTPTEGLLLTGPVAGNSGGCLQKRGNTAAAGGGGAETREEELEEEKKEKIPYDIINSDSRKHATASSQSPRRKRRRKRDKVYPQYELTFEDMNLIWNSGPESATKLFWEGFQKKEQRELWNSLRGRNLTLRR